jgi:hypothetical protein
MDGEIGIGTCFHVGEGVFVTARHVVQDRSITKVGFDSEAENQRILRSFFRPGGAPRDQLRVIKGPFNHSDRSVDVSCFKLNWIPSEFVLLGGHIDDLMRSDEFVLYRTLVVGYPPVPFAKNPVLVASVGEVNAQMEKYTGGHPHFVISTIARGGFSGAPVLVAYDEDNVEGGTALLGIVTESLVNKDRGKEEIGYMAVLTVEPIYACLEQHGLVPKGQERPVPE